MVPERAKASSRSVPPAAPLDDLPWSCPLCRAPVGRHGRALACEGCGAVFPDRGDWLDFLPERGAAERARKRGLGPGLMQNPLLARAYERIWRPGFVAIATRRLPDAAGELRFIEEALLAGGEGPVLDLSCGPGVIGRRLAQRRAAGAPLGRLLGLDLSEPMLRRCAELCRAEGVHDFPLVRADVAAIPLADAALAGVHAGAGLHVWPDPEAAIREVARVLRPGGRFVASTFVHRRGAGSRRLGRAFEATSRVRVFEVGELEQLCARHGLREFVAIERASLILFRTTREPEERRR